MGCGNHGGNSNNRNVSCSKPSLHCHERPWEGALYKWLTRRLLRLKALYKWLTRRRLWFKALHKWLTRKRLWFKALHKWLTRKRLWFKALYKGNRFLRRSILWNNLSAWDERESFSRRSNLFWKNPWAIFSENVMSLRSKVRCVWCQGGLFYFF